MNTDIAASCTTVAYWFDWEDIGDTNGFIDIIAQIYRPKYGNFIYRRFPDCHRGPNGAISGIDLSISTPVLWSIPKLPTMPDKIIIKVYKREAS